MKYYSLLVLFSFLFVSCDTESSSTKLKLLPGNETGIDFVNTVENTKDFNIFNYRNFYNGGGVAAGDINNDGLVDLYFTANRGINKLYLNKGNLKFEDITISSGTGLQNYWSTGVVMADINADGLLDIYVCNAGYQKDLGQENALFINNGDLTFTERAQQYGLADGGYTTHTAFFDYDLDGDLDAYILNNSFIPVNTLNNANNRDLRAEDWPVKDFLKGGGDKLLRNDGVYENGVFVPSYVDVSETAGIFGSLIGFGLGVTVGDINNDSYPDIYVSNDFYEKDYLYINQQDGTFVEESENRVGHTSFASMGADMADINNDGRPEIFVTDMLPRDEIRLKTTTAFDSHYSYDLRLEKGFYHQYMQNTLQLNDGSGKFYEVANLANVSASDWSWGALMFDVDNDRNTDIFVCNGIQHDVIDQDFIDFFANELSQKMAQSGKKEGVEKILTNIPSKPLPNLIFRNNGNLSFEEVSKAWGITEPTFSNGATYADLDNDGDLDLVINNVNQEAHVYENATDSTANYLKVRLKGDDLNTYAVGSKVTVHKGNEIIFREQIPSRGFQSSTAYELVFGLGDWDSIDSLLVYWPNRTCSVYKNPRPNATLEIDFKAVERFVIPHSKQVNAVFEQKTFDHWSHVENRYEDYYYEKNIPFKLSEEGPSASLGVLTKSGEVNYVFGGGKNQKIEITGTVAASPVFEQHKAYEETAIQLFDADGDGDLDLYAGSGGNEYEVNNPLLVDRLYLNDGNGGFKYQRKALPFKGFNTSTVVPFDSDNDGDIDLFVGSRSYPKIYGKSPTSYLLKNNGTGSFSISQEMEIGMVRDATYSNGRLIVVGDWMYPMIFELNNGHLDEIETGIEEYYGFWSAVEVADYNKDGKPDLLLGNKGENFPLDVDLEKPLKLYINDFDSNGNIDKVLAKTVNKKEVPVFLKREITDQFPFLKSQSLKHADYAEKTLKDLFGQELLSNSEIKKVNYLKSAVAIANVDGSYSLQALPLQFQFSSILDFQAIQVQGKNFLLAAGNSRNMIPQFNTLDASRGWVFDLDEKAFVKNSGFEIEGEVKQILVSSNKESSEILVLRNDQSPVAFKVNE